jgi:hypothetical protein
MKLRRLSDIVCIVTAVFLLLDSITEFSQGDYLTFAIEFLASISFLGFIFM